MRTSDIKLIDFISRATDNRVRVAYKIYKLRYKTYTVSFYFAHNGGIYIQHCARQFKDRHAAQRYTDRVFRYTRLSIPLYYIGEYRRDMLNKPVIFVIPRYRPRKGILIKLTWVGEDLKPEVTYIVYTRIGYRQDT